tara:strand:+ start:420 stop:524 length:105 start_codon:yes stop_codon:yes gene_type:complete
MEEKKEKKKTMGTINCEACGASNEKAKANCDFCD